ncbi:hypothetical protein [Corynebacterium mastitidis]|uniref:hypothetical protein n=1 Tax=Corynebacterium mastitidis TaxID=161890 RepID=UPI00254B76DE|nr:hypothetical protein [Corynebacterium mastitidis]MDK8449505.1 hypothetical protein [Corynebacterium mastitidis]
MKLSRKLAVSVATVSIAASTAVAPAMAATPAVKPGKTYEEQVQQAELTGKRLDNAKKGVETAKGIVDTLGGLGGLFGMSGGGEK